MVSCTMSVISRANALALQGYRHCCHVMLHSPVEEKLFGFYPVKHAVLVSAVFIVKTVGNTGNTEYRDTYLHLIESQYNLLCYSSFFKACR